MNPENHQSNLYQESYFGSIHEKSFRSASEVVPLVFEKLHPKTVLDVGCGSGSWLMAWKNAGVTCTGLDGYADVKHLAEKGIESFQENLSGDFDLGRKFDLVQCLEVAEHLEPQHSEKLVKNLCAHSDFILFSAAPQGQGGVGHINEKSYDEWRDLFKAKNYIAFDFIRPEILKNKRVEPWYRYNLMLYVNRSKVDSLPASVRASRVDEDSRILDVSPIVFKTRKLIFRILPLSWVMMLAKLKRSL